MTTEYKVYDFKKRTTAPTQADGPMWTAYGFGGKSVAILGKPQAWRGSVLNNCVGYAYGRIWELAGEKPINAPIKAYQWYGQPYYLKGKKARYGAVACFKEKGVNSGHVAVVEGYTKNSKGQFTRIDITESGYNYYKWRYVKIYRTYCMITDDKGKTTKHYNYKCTADGRIIKTNNTFQGYVYPIRKFKKEV